MANRSISSNSDVDSGFHSIKVLRRPKSFDAMTFLKDSDNEEDLYDGRSCNCPMCVWEIQDDAMHLRIFEEKKQLADQLANCHQKEEDVIDRLVDCQMRMDEMQADREADRDRIQELLELNSLLEAENMQMERDLSLASQQRGNRSSMLGRSNGGFHKQPPAELFRRIKELELVIEKLRTELMETKKEAERKAERWKFIELQKEKLSVRRELHRVHAELDWTRRRAATAEKQLAHQKRIHLVAEDALRQARQKSMGIDQDQIISNKLCEFTNQVVRLQRHCSRMAMAAQNQSQQSQHQSHTPLRHIKDQQRPQQSSNLSDMRAVCKSVQDLSERVRQLNFVETAATYGSFKDLSYIDDARMESSKANNHLTLQHNFKHAGPASSPKKSIDWKAYEILQQKNLQLEIENKKLRKIIEKLRVNLVQVDPHFSMKYHYVTSL